MVLSCSVVCEPDHPRAGNWCYALQLGPLEHKLPPIVAHRWQRVTFIVTSGDRFLNAFEINDLFEQESPVGQLYVRLKELGIPVEREWWIDKERTAYVVDLALPVGDGWLPVSFGERPGLAAGLRFEAEAELEACLRETQARLRIYLHQTALSHADGSYPKLLDAFARVQLLVLDDWLRDPLTRPQS